MCNLHTGINTGLHVLWGHSISIFVFITVIYLYSAYCNCLQIVSNQLYSIKQGNSVCSVFILCKLYFLSSTPTQNVLYFCNSVWFINLFPPAGLTNTSSSSNLVFPGCLLSRYWPAQPCLASVGDRSWAAGWYGCWYYYPCGRIWSPNVRNTNYKLTQTEGFICKNSELFFTCSKNHFFILLSCFYCVLLS